MSHQNKPKSRPLNEVVSQRIFKFPKKEQGIIIGTIDNARFEDYLLELIKIVNPNEIISASKIYNNRIRIYLSSKDIVDKLVDKDQAFIVINEQQR